MTKAEILTALRAAGTAQNRTVYGRHGVRGEVLGVGYAHLHALARTIRMDHALARDLWATGVHDARVLATMIADPTRITGRDLDAWARDLDNYVLTDALAKIAAGSPAAERQMRKWRQSRGEWTGYAGWLLLAHAAMHRPEMADEEFEEAIRDIESRIAGAKNRVRHGMNGALIAIGLRNTNLRRIALEAARRIGPVAVDHRGTGCKTPDATVYISRATARRAPARRTPRQQPVRQPRPERRARKGRAGR